MNERDVKILAEGDLRSSGDEDEKNETAISLRAFLGKLLQPNRGTLKRHAAGVSGEII